MRQCDPTIPENPRQLMLEAFAKSGRPSCLQSIASRFDDGFVEKGPWFRNVSKQSLLLSCLFRVQAKVVWAEAAKVLQGESSYPERTDFGSFCASREATPDL